LKATGRTAHGGGRRFAPGSWEHQALRDWIAAGARRDEGSGAVKSLGLSPKGDAVIKPRETGKIRVIARFMDGTEEDMTRLSGFRIQDEAVARVDSPGVVRAARPGDTALLVSYRGNVRSIRVLVPNPPRSYPRPSEDNYIDREVFAKL